MLQSSTSGSIYNNTVDELTRTMTRDGYRVLISVAYPEPGTDKHIIWVNSAKGKAFKYSWSAVADEPALWTAEYKEGWQATDVEWEFVYNVYCGDYEMTSEEQQEIVDTFIQVYRANSTQKKSVPAKPKLEAGLGKTRHQ